MLDRRDCVLQSRLFLGVVFRMLQVRGPCKGEDMNYIGCGRRFLAYIIDIIPIVFALYLIAYLFLGFDEVLHNYFKNKHDLEARADFLFQRNLIRDSSLIVWITYCIVMESSGMRATIGKRLVGAVVVTEAGAPLNFRQALIRNISKIISILPLFIGFLWIAFSKKRQAWHDKIAKTYVVQINDSTIKARDQSPGPGSGF
jgi:uncharacterized RDD family membrane protein YckC